MQRASKLEWACGILGLALILLAIGFMTWQVLRSDARYPDLRLVVTDIRPQGERYLVVVRVQNRGGASAQAVRVRGRLAGTGGDEASEATVDYVPAGSARQVGLYFRHDPARYRLELRTEGYQEP